VELSNLVLMIAAGGLLGVHVVADRFGAEIAGVVRRWHDRHESKTGRSC
jgi:hypothetical protein